MSPESSIGIGPYAGSDGRQRHLQTIGILTMSLSLLSEQAHAVSSRLRHLSREIREARQLFDPDTAFENAWCALDRTLKQAIDINILPPEIAKGIQAKRATSGRRIIAGPYYAKTIIGYDLAMKRETEVSEGCLVELATIEPGLIAKQWPAVFETIWPYAGPLTIIEDPDDLWDIKQFEVAGFQALACEYLARWIEEHPLSDEALAGLTPAEKRWVSYLTKHPSGVSYDEAMKAKEGGERVTTASSRSSITAMLQRLSTKLFDHSMSISTLETKNLIILTRLTP